MSEKQMVGIRIAALGLVAACAVALLVSLDVSSAEAEENPTEVTINLLPGPKRVVFRHAEHSKQTKCDVCHHEGDGRICASEECHTKAAREKVPGLKTAIHKQCMPCHRKNKAPAKCAGEAACHGS